MNTPGDIYRGKNGRFRYDDNLPSQYRCLHKGDDTPSIFLFRPDTLSAWRSNNATYLIPKKWGDKINIDCPLRKNIQSKIKPPAAIVLRLRIKMLVGNLVTRQKLLLDLISPLALQFASFFARTTSKNVASARPECLVSLELGEIILKAVIPEVRSIFLMLLGLIGGLFLAQMCPLWTCVSESLASS